MCSEGYTEESHGFYELTEHGWKWVCLHVEEEE